MLSGVALPASNETDSMPMLYHLWSREALHKDAALAFKRPGRQLDWWKDIADGFPNMRDNLNVDLGFLQQQYVRGGLLWSRDTLESLVER